MGFEDESEKDVEIDLDFLMGEDISKEHLPNPNSSNELSIVPKRLPPPPSPPKKFVPPIPKKIVPHPPPQKNIAPHPPPPKKMAPPPPLPKNGPPQIISQTKTLPPPKEIPSPPPKKILQNNTKKTLDNVNMHDHIIDNENHIIKLHVSHSPSTLKSNSSNSVQFLTKKLPPPPPPKKLLRSLNTSS